jgi:hypothetical protein
MLDYKLDAERRVAVRKARWEHAVQALEFFEAEGERRRALRLAIELHLLRPHWRRPGATKEAAVAAFNADPGKAARLAAVADAMLEWLAAYRDALAAAADAARPAAAAPAAAGTPPP